MRLNDEQKLECVKLYNSGINAAEIGRKFNVTNTAILGILKRRYVTIRGSGLCRKYTYNMSIFDNIDNEQKAYWLGFIFGDGSVNSSSLSIELSNRDKEHLYKFISFINGSQKVVSTKKDCCKVNINSKDFVQKLSKFGIIPNKTYSDLRTPNIDSSYINAFYRGILDSDGWITEHKYKNRINSQYEFGFSSYSISFLKEIQSWCSIILGKPSGYLIERKKENQRCCQLIIGGRNNFIKLYDNLYLNSNIYLDRKYEKATSFYRIIKT